MKKQQSEILVQNILDKIGSAANVKNVYHCATRMRLSLFDDSVVNIDELKTIANLHGALWSNGELQLIIGPEVSQITSLFKTNLQPQGEGLNDLTKPLNQKVAASSVSPWKRFLKSVSAIFGPLIPFLIGVGLVMALQALLIQTGAIHEIKGELGSDYNIFDLILNVIASSGFKLLGVVAMWSTVRYLGGKTPTALALALIMVSPLIPADGVHLFSLGSWDITLKPFYSTILVFMAMGVVVAYSQKAMEKYFHPVANFILNPLITILVGGLLAFFIMGPIMGVLEYALNAAFAWIMNWPIGLGTLVVGLTWQPLVVLGVHNILFLAATNAITATEGIAMKAGGLFLAAAFAAAWAQMGATIAVGLRAKKMTDKSAAFAAALPGIISGPTESCIYAINLPRSLPFFTGVLAGGIGGWAVGIFGLTLENLAGLGGIVGFLAYPSDLLKAIIIDVASFGLGILITYFLWREVKTEKSLSKKTLKNFINNEFIKGDIDYHAQQLIKIVKQQSNIFNKFNKKYDKNECLKTVTTLKVELVKINQDLNFDRLIKNIKANKIDLKFNWNLIKQLKTITTTNQVEINKIYQSLNQSINSLKLLNQYTADYNKIITKKANAEYALNKIADAKETKNAKLFNQAQKLMASNNQQKHEKGQLLLAESQKSNYKLDKIKLLTDKVAKYQEQLEQKSSSLQKETDQFYVQIENDVNKIADIKSKDLTIIKNQYFNDIHSVEIKGKIIPARI